MSIVSSKWKAMIPAGIPENPILSDGAFRLYAILKTYERESGKCWPSIDELADKMHRDPRTIGRYLRELEAAGLVRTKRTGRESVYVLSDRTEMSDLIGQECPFALEEEARTKSSSAAAAEPEEKPEEKQANPVHSSEPKQPLPATDDLTALGLPRELAEHYASHSPDLAPAVVQHCRERFADPKRKCVENPIAYIRGAFSNPVTYGFIRDDAGRWHPPRDGPAPQPVKDARPIIAEIERQRSAAAAAGPVSLKALHKLSR